MATKLTSDHLESLRDLPMSELRKMWRDLFGEESHSRNKDYLRRRIAYRLQEKEEGGLSQRARERLDALIQDFEVRVRRALPPLPSPKPARDPRLPAAGTILTRVYRKTAHRVTVLEDGFEYVGKRFNSLSEVAREITGTRWNGFGFFNLLDSKEHAA
jgi:hypothetical protein